MSDVNVHFYIDFCPFEQAIRTLQALDEKRYISKDEIDEIVQTPYRSEVRKRLEILNLVEEGNNSLQKKYKLTTMGQKVKEISYYDTEILSDVFHYLHLLYDPSNPSSPKMLWSYLTCCQLFWDTGELKNYKDIASFVQSKMEEDFPELDITASVGVRFDHYAVGRWAGYIRNLNPSPVDEVDKRLQKRTINRYELILLAINYLYKKHNFRFGDPVVLSPEILAEISFVFFLNPECTKYLIDIAIKISTNLIKRDTYAGMSITLKEPYGIERI